MPTVVFIFLALLALGLLAWIVLSVSRRKAFAPTDAIALLGLVVTLLVAVMPFVLSARDAPAAPTVTPAAPTSQVRIEGPDTALLGQRTFFTIISSNAQRAEWSIGGFAGNDVFVVNPLPPSHAIYIEPTDASRVGNSFMIAVTVYGADGQTATATRKFTVVGQ